MNKVALDVGLILDPKGKFSVNDIAKSLGGGGHAYAAGAQVDGNLDSVIKTTVFNSIKSISTKIRDAAL